MVNSIERCPACESSDIKEVVIADQRARQQYLLYSRLKYKSFLDDWLENIDLVINACNSCRHHWYRDQPDANMLMTMYAIGLPLHKEKGNVKDRTASPKMLVEMQKFRKLLLVKSPRLLDYGSGFGRWARAGVKAGFEVTAYEPSEERGCEQDVTRFTLIHNTGFLKGQKFDAINLEQVLEHVPDPLSILQEVRNYCVPGALVRVSVPNILRCPEGMNLWKEWPFNGERAHIMAPFEHLHGFTPRSLLCLASRAGYETVYTARYFESYPLVALRRLVGCLFPWLGQTFLILRLPKEIKKDV